MMMKVQNGHEGAGATVIFEWQCAAAVSRLRRVKVEVNMEKLMACCEGGGKVAKLAVRKFTNDNPFIRSMGVGKYQA